MQVDYIIVGQGISGSLLALGLLKEDCKILVIDDNMPFSASKVAGGIINPVTGMRLVRSWMADQLLPFAYQFYNTLSEGWRIPLIQECCILDFFSTQEMKEIFIEKQVSESIYLDMVYDDDKWDPYFRFNYGIGAIRSCLLLDIRTLLEKCRQELIVKDALLEEKFGMNDCVVSKDKITYQNITAKKIIFCDGVASADNPYFERLPWSKDKGETLIVSIPGLPRTHIFKQGISIIPWENDLFWVGASHNWKFTEMEPTIAFRSRVEEQLNYWIKLPYKIVDHIVAQRPSNMERKPFVGLHPVYSSVGILNGMGGKGCSMAPYFAHELVQHLLRQAPIKPDADVRRFTRILSK